MPASLAPLYVGSSGFAYPTWRGGFYAADAKPRDFLRLYADRLPSVELNSTFYRLPAEEQFRAWAAGTPAGFRFTVKLPARIAHGGQLQLLPTFAQRARLLGDRLGPVLVPLHPDRPRDEGFLQLLLGSLDPGLDYAFELRNETWDDPAVDAMLAAARVARVNSLDGAASFRYLRLREPPYDDAALAGCADLLVRILDAGAPVYAYFQHEDEPTAPRYAARLNELVTAGRRRP